jgi:hypothetical protein
VADDDSDIDPFDTLELGITEAGRSFDNQTEILSSIDDLAIGTLRVAIVLLGLVASTLALGGPEEILALSFATAVLLGAGIFQLLASAVITAFAYGQDPFAVGVGVADGAPDDDLELADAWIGDFDQRRISVLVAYVRRIESLNEVIEHQADLLRTATEFLVMGTVALLLASFARIIAAQAPFPTWAQLLYVLVFVVAYPAVATLADRLLPVASWE